MDYRIRSDEIVPSINALSPGLFNKTIGLIGMGDIAYEFCKLVQPFNVTILIHSPTSPRDRWTGKDQSSPSDQRRYPNPIPHTRVSSLTELLRESDVVSIHCPLTEKTRGMISEKELRMMKDGAVLINTSRGQVVDELALGKVLDQGKLGGAGLDVFQIEPAHGETLGILREMKNVICLPHL